MSDIDPGETFNPDHITDTPDAHTDGQAGQSGTLLPAVTWKVGDVKAALHGASITLDNVAGDRVFASLELTPKELDSIAVPLTNIINKRPALAAIATQSDIIALALSSIGYATRVHRERVANLFTAAMQLEHEGYQPEPENPQTPQMPEGGWTVERRAA